MVGVVGGAGGMSKKKKKERAYSTEKTKRRGNEKKEEKNCVVQTAGPNAKRKKSQKPPPRTSLSRSSQNVVFVLLPSACPAHAIPSRPAIKMQSRIASQPPPCFCLPHLLPNPFWFSDEKVK